MEKKKKKKISPHKDTSTYTWVITDNGSEELSAVLQRLKDLENSENPEHSALNAFNDYANFIQESAPTYRVPKITTFISSPHHINKKSIDNLARRSINLFAEKTSSNVVPNNDELLKFTLKKIEKLESEIEGILKRTSKLEAENNNIKDIILNDVNAADASEKIQLLPVHIYLDTNNAAVISEVYTAVLGFITSIKFEIAVEFAAIRGSWIKDFIIKSKELLTSHEVTSRLKEAEYAIEVNTILKPLSEVEKNQSEALLNVLKAVESSKNAAIKIGSLLILKTTNSDGDVSVVTKTLTILEMHYLNKRSDLLNKPLEIMSGLAQLNEGQLPNPN